MLSSARVLGLVAASLGAWGLLAWCIGLGDATALRAGWATMKVNTAGSLLLLGLALSLRGTHWVAAVLRAVVGGLAATTLCEWALGIDLGIDALLWDDPTSVEGGHPPGRMAPATAVALLLLATSGLTAWARDPRPSQVFGLSAAAVGWIALLGYATELGPFAAVPAFGTVSLPTAIAVTLLGIGTAQLRPGEGLLTLWYGGDEAATLVRRLGPVVLLLPAASGFAGLHVGRAWQPGFGPAVAATVNAVLFGGVLLYTAAATRREANERREAAHARDLLARRLVEATERERADLARELHDHFGQLVTSTVLLADRLPEESRMPLRDALVELGDELRRVSVSLRPPLLDVAGLGEAIRTHVEAWSAGAGVPADVVVTGDDHGIADHLALTAYRVVQEALTNVARHANARHVTVSLRFTPMAVHVSVADDGVGFASGPTEPGRLGLAGLAERARMHLGAFKVLTGPTGTTVDVTLPVYP